MLSFGAKLWHTGAANRGVNVCWRICFTAKFPGFEDVYLEVAVQSGGEVAQFVPCLSDVCVCVCVCECYGQPMGNVSLPTDFCSVRCLRMCLPSLSYLLLIYSIPVKLLQTCLGSCRHTHTRKEEGFSIEKAAHCLQASNCVWFHCVVVCVVYIFCIKVAVLKKFSPATLLLQCFHRWYMYYVSKINEFVRTSCLNHFSRVNDTGSVGFVN